MGYVRCLKLRAADHAKSRGGGRVVNLIGNDGVKPSYWEIAPGAANAAGQNLTISLAGQYGKRQYQLRRGQSGPGAHRTLGRPRQRDVARHEASRYEEADKLAPAASRWAASPKCEEVANLVAYAAPADLAHFVNGTMIEIDGGQDKALMDRIRDR